jgi:predicted regulator of Ras-like GTPase activity (Roadblock/LC7/MglB family)
LFWRSPDDPTAETAVEPTDGDEPVAPSNEPLPLLRDVQGVLGSLVISPGGAVYARDLPPNFDEHKTARLAQRLAQLYETLAGEGGHFEAGTLQYQGHQFHVSCADGGLIGVLTEQRVNLPALAMALKVVARRIATAQMTLSAPRIEEPA